MKLYLQIDELFIDGFRPGDKHSIAIALERELIRLFSEQGIPSSLMHPGNVENISGVSFEMNQVSHADALGVQVARSVYGGLKR